MVQDTSLIKEKIVNFINSNGASLPVEIAKHIETSILFTSAFLSELVSEQKLKLTQMKVGSSPIYYNKGKEESLEKYGQYLKSKEKEAFELIKDKKFLIDSEQTTAIRVALRSIKDFAKGFEKENKLIWRYFLNEENQYSSQIENKEKQGEIKNTPTSSKLDSGVKKTLKEKIPKKEVAQKPKKSTSRKKAQDKKNERFFNTVKKYLNSKDIEISDIIGFSKENLILKIIEQNKEKILVAYNKKRLTESDILSAYKKIQDHKIPYSLLSFGDTTKKTLNTIEAIRNLDSIRNLNQNL